MRRKLLFALLIVLLSMTFAWAETQTQIIYLVSVVTRTYPQFTLRNCETGEIGLSQVYSTSKISEGDVRTDFDIIQTNNSNYRGFVNFSISATELTAMVHGRIYSTEGVSIFANGIQYGSEASFERMYTGSVKAGATVECFEVIWKTSAFLRKGEYQAQITLSYSTN